MTPERPARLFDELGRLVEARWREANYGEAVLPDIAASALEQIDLPRRVEPWELLREFHTTYPQPEQRDIEGRFSDLPLTLYNGTRFYIDAYYWLDGTTEIHQHAFAGAFQVLSGSSLHSRYAFEREREINPHFLTGRVRLDDVETLRAGATRRIIPGLDHIHSLFHLERPSVTITVRSHHTPTAAPQYSYLKPFLAVNPFHREPSLIRKVQTATFLLKMGHPEACARIGEILADSDFETAFRVLEAAAPHLRDGGLYEGLGLARRDDRLAGLTERARSRHGGLVDLIEPVLDERRRQMEISRKRGLITEEGHRFLLALLLNVPDRSRVIELVAQRCPDEDPIETIVDWVEELGVTREADADQNVLGIASWDDDHVFVFECLLRGMGEAQVDAEISARYASKVYAESLVSRSRDIAAKIRSSVLFQQHL